MRQINPPPVGQDIRLDETGSLVLRAAEDLARFSLRLDPSAAATAATAFGAPLPARIGGTANSDGRLALRLGPDEWQLLAPLAESEAIVESFARLQPAHSLVDIGHRLRRRSHAGRHRLPDRLRQGADHPDP